MPYKESTYSRTDSNNLVKIFHLHFLCLKIYRVTNIHYSIFEILSFLGESLK